MPARSRPRVCWWVVQLLAAAVAMQATQAQTTEETPRLDVNIGSVLYVNLSNVNLTFAPGATDLNAGFISLAQPSLLVYAGNVRHSARIVAASATMVGTLPGNSKPASDVQWSADGVTWAPFTTTSVPVAPDAVPGLYSVPLRFRATVSFDDAPDTYTLNFTITILAT